MPAMQAADRLVMASLLLRLLSGACLENRLLFLGHEVTSDVIPKRPVAALPSLGVGKMRVARFRILIRHRVQRMHENGAEEQDFHGYPSVRYSVATMMASPVGSMPASAFSKSNPRTTAVGELSWSISKANALSNLTLAILALPSFPLPR